MSTDTKTLAVVIEGQVVGTLIQNRYGQLDFEYEGRWVGTSRTTPLSLSMPPTYKKHSNKVVFPFIDGLLPDNDNVRARWRRDFHIYSRNPFALLRKVGAEVAGGAQFIPLDNVESTITEGDIEWLTEAQIGTWLRALQEDPTIWHRDSRTGQYSLGGAQPKIALHYDGKRWGIPTGVVPTTHILKPDVPGYFNHHLNEHLCLRLAKTLALPVAESTIRDFDGAQVVAVTRYDRMRTPTGWKRLHQEDFCQMLGIGRNHKYQIHGGPGAVDILTQLALHEGLGSTGQQVMTFIDYIAFQWLIGGTDAHAKNYSILLSGDQVRLAPLYDLASGLILSNQPEHRFEDIKLAMSIGSAYSVAMVTGSRWIQLAYQAGLDAGTVLERVSRLVEKFPEAVEQECETLFARGIAVEYVSNLRTRLLLHSGNCQVLLRVVKGHSSVESSPFLQLPSSSEEFELNL